MNINEPRDGGGFVLPFFNDSKKSRKSHAGRDSLKSNQVPFTKWVPDTVSYTTKPLKNAHRWLHLHNKTRNHFVATVAEFAGTTLFLFFAFSGTQVALLATPANNSNVVGTPSNPAQLLYVSLCFGFSLAVNAWVFFRISGGLFNPAVRTFTLFFSVLDCPQVMALTKYRSQWECVSSVLSHISEVFF